MHTNDLSHWQHDHTFGQDQIKAGEKRTLFVVILTAVMMVIEIIAGIVYGSMALLADVFFFFCSFACYPAFLQCNLKLFEILCREDFNVEPSTIPDGNDVDNQQRQRVDCLVVKHEIRWQHREKGVEELPIHEHDSRLQRGGIVRLVCTEHAKLSAHL